ncbi:glycosyltransferase [Neobacillus cucumis]|nr:glycosyltransferase [Neobacillus cucumis]
MDFTQLENRLIEIRKMKESLKDEIQKSRRDFGTIQNVLGSDWWYSTNYSYNVISDGEKLQVELPEKQHIYLSYKENNVNFSQSPDFPIIIEENKISCEMIGSASESLKATLHLIGYKDYKKVKFDKIPLNSTHVIEINKKEIDSYRIAVKIEGTGYFSLKHIKLGTKIIEGLEVKEEYGAEVMNPVLNLDLDFNRIIEFDSQSLTVPPVFSTYANMHGKELSFNIPTEKYVYLQNGPGPLSQINTSDLTEYINATSHYEFGLSASTTKNLHVELVVVGYSESSPVEVKLVKNNSKELVRFRNETTLVKFLLRLQGEGDISNIKIGICEKPRKSTFETNLDLSVSEWFNPKNSQSELQNKDKELIISSNLSDSKTSYISYKEKNNSFSKVPMESGFGIKSKCYYEILIHSNLNGSGTITPIIITYSEFEKESIINLKLNEINKIQFNESIKYCRIAFKISGTAQLIVKDFSIFQFPVIGDGGQIEWLEPREVSLLGLIPKKELKAVKMAAIFDEFTTECFSHECNLITFTPDNWKEVLTAAQPDLLMVESAWRGNNGAWIKKIQYQGEDSIKDLNELIIWCTENNIPTVFWNKEDPVHYNHFIETAKLFDFVLTTDSNMVPVYKEACGHDRVDFLQFAAQPAIHNPITIGERENAVSFAGSYYAKHIERTEDMMEIFNATLSFGLAIFDRNYEKVKQGLLPNNRFPENVEPYVRGSLKYYEIDKAYKGFKAMININTVKNSPTMFARRVYEALACGTPIISNYSEGIEEMFGDIVCNTAEGQEVKKHLQMLFEDETKYRQIVLEGIRRVYRDHTYAHRLEKIIDMLGLPFYRKETKVLVLGKANSLEELQRICEAFLNQCIPNKELCLITNDGINIDTMEVDDERIKIFSESAFFNMYQHIFEYGDFDYLANLSPSVKYDSNFLLDLNIASLYSPWEIIGFSKENGAVFGQVYSVDPDKSIFKKELFGLMSTNEIFELLMETKNFKLLQRRGARILGIPIVEELKGVER